MKTICKFLLWATCLCLRLVAWCCNGLHAWLKSGPAPRLWAATDAQVFAEAQRRGLPKTPARAEAGVPVDDAVLVVKKLNQVSASVAANAVARARTELARNRPTQEQVIQRALQYA